MRLAIILVILFAVPVVAHSTTINDQANHQTGEAKKTKAAFMSCTEPSEAISDADHAHVEQLFGQLPLYFIENRGQMNEEVAYYVKGSDKTLYFTPVGITFALTGKENNETKRWTVKLNFVDANKVTPKGDDKQKAIFSYFKGNPKDW